MRGGELEGARICLVSVYVAYSSFYREAREEAELVKHRAERPKLQQQFVDLKRGLAAVTDEEWTNIPEVGNLTRKKRKRDFERSWAVPDSVIVGNRASTEYENSLDANQQVSCVTLPSYLRICRPCIVGYGGIRDSCEFWDFDQFCGNWTSS